MGSPESIGRRMILDAGLLKILRLSAGSLRSVQKKGALRRARLENFERDEGRDLVVHAAHATAAATVAMTATSCRSRLLWQIGDHALGREQ